MLTVYGEKLTNRLLLGTAKYPSLTVLKEAILSAKIEVVTVSLRREKYTAQQQPDFWKILQSLNVRVLPNTAGCHNVKTAVATAEMARELFATDWIKLEVIGDDYTMQPNVFELVDAARQLNNRGFKVFPYCTDDLIVCQRLLEVGCEVLMPWAAPIGSGQGIRNPTALTTLRERFPHAVLIVDAGIGRPSDAVKIMELGFDAVLLNSAVACAHDPVQMAQAFSEAIHAGRAGFLAGIIPILMHARPSTPLVDTPFWHQSE